MRVLHYELHPTELGGVVAVLDIATQQSRGNADVTLATHDATDVPPDFGKSWSCLTRPLGRLGPEGQSQSGRYSAGRHPSAWHVVVGKYPVGGTGRANCPYFISPRWTIGPDQRGSKEALLQLGKVARKVRRPPHATAEQQQSRNGLEDESFSALPMDMHHFCILMAARSNPPTRIAPLFCSCLACTKKAA